MKNSIKLTTLLLSGLLITSVHAGQKNTVESNNEKISNTVKAFLKIDELYDYFRKNKIGWTQDPKAKELLNALTSINDNLTPLLMANFTAGKLNSSLIQKINKNFSPYRGKPIFKKFITILQAPDALEILLGNNTSILNMVPYYATAYSPIINQSSGGSLQIFISLIADTMKTVGYDPLPILKLNKIK